MTRSEYLNIYLSSINRVRDMTQSYCVRNCTLKSWRLNTAHVPRVPIGWYKCSPALYVLLIKRAVFVYEMLSAANWEEILHLQMLLVIIYGMPLRA